MTTLDDQELAARRAAVAATCPQCGRSLAGHGGAYAQNELPISYQSSTNFPDIGSSDAPTMPAPAKSWRDRPPLL